jgi:hypothetical protein
MGQAKTVYILGAGASCEANLPTGAKLRDQIAMLLNLTFDFEQQQTGDLVIGDAIRTHLRTIGDRTGGSSYIHAAQRIRAGMQYAVSIDNYLHQHRGDKEAELCGKLAIVRAILKAERASLMFLKPSETADRFPQSALTSTWYASLWQVLTDGCHVDDLQARFESVAFVIFNYDRCIEHYLYHALQVFYRLSPNDARELLRSLEIRHPYGIVGNLPWLGDRSMAIGFGDEPHAVKLLALSNQIKTFTESVDPTHGDIVAIRNTLRAAAKLVILGFAYYEQNMKLLWPASVESQSNSVTMCYATAFGISGEDLDIIKSELMDRTGFQGSHVKIRNDLRCHQLFSEFSKGLRIQG